MTYTKSSIPWRNIESENRFFLDNTSCSTNYNSLEAPIQYFHENLSWLFFSKRLTDNRISIQTDTAKTFFIPLLNREKTVYPMIHMCNRMEIHPRNFHGFCPSANLVLRKPLLINDQLRTADLT